MTNRLKTAPDFDLECNFDHEQSTLEIFYDIVTPSFTMETPFPDKVIICQERNLDTDMLGPEIAFTLTQTAMSPTNPVNTGTNGLIVTEELNPSGAPAGSTLVTWEFVVDGVPYSVEMLEWHLAPVDQMHAVCEIPGYPGTFFSPCVNRMGIPPMAVDTDFPDRDVDGDSNEDFDGDVGVVFRYTELVLANGTRLPRTLLFGPCHSGSYNIDDNISCDDGTNSEANVTGIVPVDVEIKPESFNTKSKGTHDIRILGEANLDPPPVADLVVNGMSVTSSSKFSFADVNDDGFLDFRAKVQRPKFAEALDCEGSGPATVTVTGTFDPEGSFTGTDTINILCK